MAAFRAELQKAHRRHDLALCLLIPGIVVLWVGGLAPADPEELANGYSALLYSLPVIEAILMPVMMAVLASRLWDMEIKGNTAKLLYTLQSRRSLFAGKAVFGVLEVLLVTVLELACVPVLGCVHGYTEAFPTGQLVYLFVCTLTVDTMLFFGEFLLMLWVGNPLPALCVGMLSFFKSSIHFNVLGVAKYILSTISSPCDFANRSAPSPASIMRRRGACPGGIGYDHTPWHGRRLCRS